MTHTLICHLPLGGGWEGAFMKTYIQPSITVVRLQQQHIICTSDPSDYADQSLSIQSGEITEESAVWTKASRSTWDQEW